MADTVKYGRFKMKYLPKPEYKLMKALMKDYGCRDESEICALAIRMLTEHSYTEVITHLEYMRSTPESERQYDLDA